MRTTVEIPLPSRMQVSVALHVVDALRLTNNLCACFRHFECQASNAFELLRQEPQTKGRSPRWGDRALEEQGVGEDKKKGSHGAAPRIFEDAESSDVEHVDESGEDDKKIDEDSGDALDSYEYGDESDEAGNESAEAPVPSDGFFDWDEMENFADELEQAEVCDATMAVGYRHTAAERAAISIAFPGGIG